MAFAPLLAPFFVLVATFVLIGMSQTHSAVKGTADTGGFLSWFYRHSPIALIVNLATQAERWLISKFASAQLRLATAWFSAFAVLWRVFFQAVGDVAHATAGAVAALDAAVPRIARREAAPARREAKIAHRTATRANTHAKAVGHQLDVYKQRTNTRVHHLTHAVDVAIPADIAGLRARNKALERGQVADRGAIGELEHGATKTWDWIRSHPLSATTGVFAGAVAIALARLGYGFMRCRSWQRLGRSLTCNDANILAQLLADATLIVGAMSLVELARAEQEVIGDVSKIVHRFWEA